MDEIYKESDPIGVSIDMRKKEGTIQSTVKKQHSKLDYFFSLKYTGEILPISQEAKDNVMILEGKCDIWGKVHKEEVKLGPC